MLKLRVLTIAAACVLSAGGLAACGDGDDNAGSAGAGSSEVAATAASEANPVQAVADGATLIDVRTQEEWDAGHAKGAVLFPLARLEAGELPDAAKDAKVIVYCRSGNRSAQAAQLLQRAGFNDITDLGALDAWSAAGGEIVD